MRSERSGGIPRPLRRAAALALTIVAGLVAGAALAASSATPSPDRIDALEARIDSLELEIDSIRYRCGCE